MWWATCFCLQILQLSLLPACSIQTREIVVSLSFSVKLTNGESPLNWYIIIKWINYRSLYQISFRGNCSKIRQFCHNNIFLRFFYWLNFIIYYEKRVHLNENERISWLNYISTKLKRLIVTITMTKKCSRYNHNRFNVIHWGTFLWALRN